MPVEFRGLDPKPFAHLFYQSDEELAAIGARLVVADEPEAFPCRISLARAVVGERLLLVNYAHQPTPSSPYRAHGPIFVSEAREAALYRDELPPALKNRIISLRAYDDKAFIVDADVGEGDWILEIVENFLARSDVAHVDAHFAKPGCFATRIKRV